MATIMLLGGSNAQQSAARRAKDEGHRVVLVDYYERPPAAELCDVHVRESTFDIPACVRAARKHRVDAVFTLGTDQPVYTAAKVAEALTLPCPISVETALRATDKRAMKRAFVRAGVPHAPFAFLRAGQRAEGLHHLAPPLVIKPLDAQGQRGVFKVGGAQEAVARLSETLSFSRRDEALVERFYPSDEVTLSCFVWRGKVYPLTLTDRQLMDDPVHIGVCAAHRYPSVHARRAAEIHAIAARTARALGVMAGPLYIQMLIGEAGIVVNEAACRIGGAFEDAFIPYATGFDILGAALGLALGREPDLSALESPTARAGRQVSVQMLFLQPGAAIADMTPLAELTALPGVLLAGYNYARGSAPPPMENALARFGHCVLATDRGDMATRVERLYRTLRVTDARGKNLVLRRTYDGEAMPDD